MTTVTTKRNLWLWSGVVAITFALFLVAKPKRQNAPLALVLEDVFWGQMTDSLKQVVSEYNGDVGIYIKDLKTGKTFEIEADHKFITASLIKVPIMAATFQAMQEGKISLGSSMKLQRWHRRDGSGDLKWLPNGRKLSVAELLFKMITKSDNTAAQMFIDRFGYDYLNKRFSDLGLSVTRISPVGMSLANRVDPERDNYTTPREMGILMEKIYRHEIVNDGYCDLMIEIMKQAERPMRSRLARFLPDEWMLARKGGLLRKNCHDVGLVFTGRNDYVICVLTGKNTTYKEAKALIANVGQTAYSFIGRT